MRRPRPQLFPTNMALRDGLPATGSARALFSLVFQRPVAQSFGPADFLVSGLFQDAYLQAVPMPGRQAACFSGCLEECEKQASACPLLHHISFSPLY